MRKSKDTNPNCVGLNNVNIISEKTKIEGKLSLDNDLRLDGEILGDIISESKVVIGETGIVKGTLTCENAEIYGNVFGDLEVRSNLTVRSTAEINGNLNVKTLLVEANAIINGTCSMKSDIPNVLEDNETK